MIKIKTFIKKRKYWIGASVLLLVLAGYFFLAGGKKAPTGFFTVTRGEVNSEVSVTGEVKPTQNLDLAFEKSGRIRKIYVKVGDKVGDGQILVSLDNSDLSAQLLQAEASAKAAQAKLDQLKKGTRPEDLRITQSALDKANQDLANYYSGVSDILNDAYSKADDAVRLQTASMFSNAEKNNLQLTFQISDSQLEIDLENQRQQMTSELNAWRNKIDQLDFNTNPSVLEGALTEGESYLSDVSNFLSKASDAVTNAVNLSQTTASTYKTAITVGKTEVNSAETNVDGRRQAILSQKIVVQQNQNQLNLQLAGSEPEEITIQQANVDQAEANVAYYGAQIEKGILRAPFGGTVTKVNYNPGDIIPVNTGVVSLIGGGAYEIEANVAESDIADVKIGDTARVTLDAYGSGVVFEAKVVQIDLGATIIDGVATYKTTLQFTKEDSRILTGLTANVDIMSEKKDNVLYVPTRNIGTDDNGNRFVQILRDSGKGINESVQIKTGLRGSDGRTEVISGLNEGDKIVNQ